MSNISEQFKTWVREKHLKECSQCRKEGKARLIDSNAYAVSLFKEFYKEILNN